MTSSSKAARQKLIKKEMLYLLEDNKVRFSMQLLSRLLAEGCNLPLVLAGPRFYGLMIQGLLTLLDGPERKRFEHIENRSELKTEHAQFYRAMRFFTDCLKGAELEMTKASLEALATIVSEWQLEGDFFQQNQIQFDLHLKTLIQEMAGPGSDATLSQLPVTLVRRRLYIALTTSLLRFVNNPPEFQARFGTVSEALAAMRADHSVFCRVMAFFMDGIPYGAQAASQTFWRTLQTLDNETQAPFPE